MISALITSALVAAFFIWLLTNCLRRGVVGAVQWPGQRNAYRDKQPIRYWIGIAGLALGATMSVFGLAYLVVLALH